MSPYWFSTGSKKSYQPREVRSKEWGTHNKTAVGIVGILTVQSSRVGPSRWGGAE